MATPQAGSQKVMDLVARKLSVQNFTGVRGVAKKVTLPAQLRHSHRHFAMSALRRSVPFARSRRTSAQGQVEERGIFPVGDN